MWKKSWKPARQIDRNGISKHFWEEELRREFSSEHWLYFAIIHIYGRIQQSCIVIIAFQALSSPLREETYGRNCWSVVRNVKSRKISTDGRIPSSTTAATLWSSLTTPITRSKEAWKKPPKHEYLKGKWFQPETMLRTRKGTVNSNCNTRNASSRYNFSIADLLDNAPKDVSQQPLVPA